MELNPRGIYLTLNLKWGLENYVHEIGLNVTHPGYVSTALYHKGLKLPKPEYLYKFYSSDDYNFESLENPYLYFGNPSEFNDTFDCVISNDEYIKTFLDNSYFENVGICNFSIKKTSQMWTFYSEKHKGFAVKFKNNRLFLPYSDDISIKSHVLYLKNNIPDHPNLIETLKSIENKHAPEPVRGWQHQVLFHHDLCRKNNSFVWEDEYRFITFTTPQHNRRIEFNPLTIDSIYIGHRMSEPNLKRIKEILKNLPHVKVFKTLPNPRKQIIEEVRVKDLNKLI